MLVQHVSFNNAVFQSNHTKVDSNRIQQNKAIKELDTFENTNKNSKKAAIIGGSLGLLAMVGAIIAHKTIYSNLKVKFIIH